MIVYDCFPHSLPHRTPSNTEDLPPRRNQPSPGQPRKTKTTSISLRKETLARLDYFQGRIPSLLDNRLSFVHLTRRAGEEAIRQPLTQYNRDQQSAYTIEEALVTAVLHQVGSGQVDLSR
jgi:hypothetical protein